MAGGRAGNPCGRQCGRRDGNTVRGEQGQAGPHWAGLEPSQFSLLMKWGSCKSSLVAFVTELKTALARAWEKLQGDQGESSSCRPNCCPSPRGSPADTKMPAPPLQASPQTDHYFTSTFRTLARNLSCGTSNGKCTEMESLENVDHLAPLTCYKATSTGFPFLR